MKKKLIAGVLVIAMIASMCACSSKNKEMTENENGYIDIDIEASEYVKLGEYKNIKIQGQKAEVTEEELNERLEEEKLNYAEYKKIDRQEVQDQDIVNINYVAVVGGEIIQDVSEDNIDILIGEGALDNYLQDVDLEAGLVGVKVGETKKFTGKFVEDFYIDTIAGKEGNFEITVNSIEEEVYPEFTDAFVKENLNYDTFDQYKESVREELMEEAQSFADENNAYLVFDKIVENSEVIKDFPEDIKAAERSNCILSVTMQASYMGEEIGDTEEELENYFKENFDMTIDEYTEDSLKRSCVMDLILQAEKEEIKEEDIDNAIKEEYEMMGIDIEGEGSSEMEEDIDREEYRYQLEYQKCMDIIMATAIVE